MAYRPTDPAPRWKQMLQPHERRELDALEATIAVAVTKVKQLRNRGKDRLYKPAQRARKRAAQ